MNRIDKKLNVSGEIALQSLKQNFIVEDLGYIIQSITQGKELVKKEDTTDFVMSLRPELDANTASIVARQLEMFQSEIIKKLTQCLVNYKKD